MTFWPLISKIDRSIFSSGIKVILSIVQKVVAFCDRLEIGFSFFKSTKFQYRKYLFCYRLKTITDLLKGKKYKKEKERVKED
jgi:hypothetical protein